MKRAEEGIHTISLADQLMLAYEAEKMRRSLKLFVSEAWNIIEPVPFVGGWCVDAICEHLEALSREQFRFLVITIPPRHTKSTLSVMWSAWNWLHVPEDRYLRASFNLDLALRDNVRIREIIRSNWFQNHFGRDLTMEVEDIHLQYAKAFGITDDQDTKRYFMNSQLGYSMACSVGGSVTGQGGSKLILDDPHSADEAHSDQKLEIARTWFREVWFNRMNNALKDKMLVIGQRIHVNDVIGMLLAEYGSMWVHLCLPEEYDPKRQCVTPIWRDPRTTEGELLWEKRFDRATIESYKVALGSIAYAAQYSQLPVPAGGATFRQDWFRYYKELPEVYVLYGAQGSRVVAKNACWRFATMDLATSLKQTADYTVLQIWDVTPHNDLLLVEQVRDRYDDPTKQRMVKMLHMRYAPEFWIIESTGFQLSLIQQLRNAPINNTDFLVSQIGDPNQYETQVLWNLPNLDAYLMREELDFTQFKIIDASQFQTEHDCYVVRVLGDTSFFVYAMQQQGYAKIEGRFGVNQHDFSINIREFRPVRDKVARASTPAILMENEQIYFLDGAAYIQPLLGELLLFPRGSHDDQIDALSMAGEVIAVPRAPLADDEWIPLTQGETRAALKLLPEPDPTKVFVDRTEVDPFAYADRLGLWGSS